LREPAGLDAVKRFVRSVQSDRRKSESLREEHIVDIPVRRASGKPVIRSISTVLELCVLTETCCTGIHRFRKTRSLYPDTAA
jgi:hypothetical protein